jgi:hypothetical protein
VGPEIPFLKKWKHFPPRSNPSISIPTSSTQISIVTTPKRATPNQMRTDWTRKYLRQSRLKRARTNSTPKFKK